MLSCDTVFVTQNLKDAGGYGVIAKSEKFSDGGCVPVLDPEDRAGSRVTEIHPSELGLSYRSNSDSWIVEGKSYSVERPEIISCDGFESCPTP